jgi:hypothetical protein
MTNENNDWMNRCLYEITEKHEVKIKFGGVEYIFPPCQNTLDIVQSYLSLLHGASITAPAFVFEIEEISYRYPERGENI